MREVLKHGNSWRIDIDTRSVSCHAVHHAPHVHLEHQVSAKASVVAAQNPQIGHVVIRVEFRLASTSIHLSSTQPQPYKINISHEKIKISY